MSICATLHQGLLFNQEKKVHAGKTAQGCWRYDETEKMRDLGQ